MSRYQLGWNRSYRQALERLTRENADQMFNQEHLPEHKRIWATAQLQLVADLWQVKDFLEVVADCAAFRQEFFKEFAESLP